MFLSLRQGRVLLKKGEGIEVQNYENALKRVFEVISGGGLGVVDEFQRLPEHLWDFIALKKLDVRGRLILCGSSLSVTGKVFSEKRASTRSFCAI